MNSFGRIFRVTLFGESHGAGVGVTIDGCPPGIPVSEEDFEKDLARRRGGARGTTPRKERDKPQVISGIYNGFTTGSPVALFFENANTRSSDYNFRDVPRPGHADFVAEKKYKGFTDLRGGGHFSGRLTVNLVAAGVIAKKVLGEVNIHATLLEAGGSKDIEKAVEEALKAGDSVGGLVECCVTGLSAGLGEPFFDSVESLISHAVFAIPAIKGIEFGSGFKAAAMRGSEHNDDFIDPKGTTETNHAAGINGGITNGNDIVFRVAVKPTSSISKPQETFNFRTGKRETLQVKGRHDACIALRVPPVLEAVTAIVLADLILINKGWQ
jgi:chorismate synthase